MKKQLPLAHGGDMAAFEALYNEMKRPLYTIILRITHDTALAEDVLQELFLKLYLSPPKPSVNPRAYLCQMARNLAIDSVRRQKTFADWEQAEPALFVQAEDISQTLDIQDAIGSLPERELQIVTLRINGDLKFREIASIMDLPLGTVLWAYQKAIEQLRTMLGGVQ